MFVHILQAPSVAFRTCLHVLCPLVRRRADRRRPARVLPEGEFAGYDPALAQPPSTPSDNMTPDERAKVRVFFVY